jgi:capsular exopolysaccharide synthesis family protein
MEFYQYIRIVTKRWWLVLLLVLVGTSSAIYYSSRQPPVYRSTVTLLLSPAINQDSLIPGALSDRTSQLAQTYIRYLKTQAFAELVLQREGLTTSASELVNALNARVVDGTQFFEITASSNDPQQAQRLATVIANNFIRENAAQQQEQQAVRRAGATDSMQALLREKLERERQYYEEQVAGLRGQIAQIMKQPASADRNEALAGVQKQLSEYETRLLQVMSDQVALQPAATSNQINTVTIIEPAQLPARPVATKDLQNILIALAASLALGVALAFGLEYLDYTVKTPEEIEQLLHQPALGVLGLIAPTANGASNDNVFLLEAPRSPTAEAFRALRTNIRFSRAGQQLRSLVITSSGPAEGKSTVAANLAVAMAHAGQRVILVDADMRRPSQHKLFHLANNAGFSSLMIADDPLAPATIERHLQAGPIETLRVLTCGPIPTNPAELLSTELALLVLAALEAQADIVIYDTPPALTVTDAVILASRADATLQVVQAGLTRRDVVLKCQDVLERVGAKLLAPVLNKVKAGDAGYYQYYYSYSGRYTYADESHAPAGNSRRNGKERQPVTRPAEETRHDAGN